MASTVTISIGRGLPSGGALRPSEWEAFRSHIDDTLADCGATVYVARAYSVGEWEGVAEESATWVASVPVECVGYLRDYLRVATDVYRQDAIALTIGETELVSA